jgi:tetratricopeptide (TPR) repeat protein
LLRQPDQALEQCLKAVEVDTDVRDNWMLARAYSQKGMFRQAIATAERNVASNPSPQLLGLLAYHYAEAGLKERAREVLNSLLRQKAPAPFPVARVYAVLGEKELAFAWLEKAYHEHAFMHTLKVAGVGSAAVGPTVHCYAAEDWTGR